MKRAVSILAVIVLSACGGGGGGGTSVGPTIPLSTPMPAAVLPASVQRTLVQQALSSTTQAQQIAAYGTSSSTLAVLRHALSGERSRQAACSGGLITTVSAGSASNVANVSIDAYYDAGCTELWYVSSGTLTATSATAGTFSGAATYYTLGGAVYRYATLTLTLSGAGTGAGYFDLAAAIAAAPNAAPFANVGIGCTISSTADGCSAGEVDHLGPLGLDQAVAISTDAVLTSSASGLTIGVSGNGTANVGSLNAISLEAQGATGWTISGGSQLDAASVSGSLTVSAIGVVTGGTLSLADARDGATVNASYVSANQSIAGSIVLNATGATVATFTVGLTGSGTISYADGSSGAIANWVVQS